MPQPLLVAPFPTLTFPPLVLTLPFIAQLMVPLNSVHRTRQAGALPRTLVQLVCGEPGRGANGKAIGQAWAPAGPSVELSLSRPAEPEVWVGAMLGAASALSCALLWWLGDARLVSQLDAVAAAADAADAAGASQEDAGVVCSAKHKAIKRFDGSSMRQRKGRRRNGSSADGPKPKMSLDGQQPSGRALLAKAGETEPLF